MPTAPASSRFRLIRALLAGLGLAVIYFLSARLGLTLASIHGNVSPVWPATGVAIGGLLLGGRRLWPAVWVAAFAANLPGTLPWWGAVIIATGNTAEAVVGAWLVERLRARPTSHPLLWETAGCCLASLLAPLCSASLGVGALALAETLGDGRAVVLGWTWWLGDALGALALVPPILAATRQPLRATLTSPGWMLAGVAAGTVAAVVFFLPPGGVMLFGLFPGLLLATRLGGELGAKAAAVAVSAVGVTASYLGHGPFISGSLNDDLLFLQFFLGSVAIAALVLPVFASVGALMSAGAFLFVGWTVSGIVFAHLYRERLAADQRRLDALVDDTERAMQQRMATYLEALRAGHSLFAASEEVTKDEWRQFTNALNAHARLPGIHALGMTRRVEAGEGSAFVDSRVPPDGDGAGSPAEGSYLIAFVEPAETGRIGLDSASEARRRRAAGEACDSGEPRASGRVELMTRAGPRAGFLAFHPIYRRGEPATTSQERRDALEGWVFAAFVAEEFFESIFMSPEVGVTVFDGKSIAPETALYATRADADPRSGVEKVRTIELAGNFVTLGLRRTGAFAVTSPVASVLTATSLALVTILLAGLGVILQSIGQQAREIAAVRTAELSAAQTTLAGVNRLHRAVLDGTAYSIIATETDGTIRIFNRGAEKMLGYRREEVIGRQTPVIIHLASEVAARAGELSAELGRRIEPGFEVFVARAALGEHEQREWTYVRRNGTHVPVSLSVSALFDDTGAITGYLGIAHDLTERHALEQSLRLEQTRLRLANEAAAIAVWEWDVETGLIDWDGAMFNLYGMVPTVGGRIGYEDWRDRVHPDDLSAQEAALHRVVRDGGRGLREFRIIRRCDGQMRYVSASDLAIAGPDGRTVRVVGINRDITEHRRAMEQERQSQARLSTIFGAVREGLLLLDADGRVLECNAAACRILGVTREQLDEARGTTALWTTVRQDGSVYPASEYPVAVTLRTGLPARDAIVGLQKPDGPLLWVSIDTAPIFDSAGAVQALVVSINDVSVQQQIARDLARARDEALETSRLKSEFLATVSHEIRTPMNGIMGTVDLLLGTPLDPTQHEMARLVQGSAENLLEIINDILDFSRIEAGKFRISPEPFELLPLLEETAALLAVRAQRKGLELVLDTAPALAAEVLVGDPGRIRQVLMNIIGNAVKFTERGEVVVSATVTPGTVGRGLLRVSVRDTGIGIATEFRDRLFSAFSQVDASVTRRYGGTGLGLAISRQLTELMGGRIDFASEPGHGSEFWIELDLPRQPGVAPAEDDADLDVLVVDDNATARDALVRQLRGLGAHAAGVDGAAAALDQLGRTAPVASIHRIVLADSTMPGVDGLDFARRLRGLPEAGEVALVLLAPPGASSAPHELAGLGCVATLAKPVRLSQLRVALSQARRGPMPPPPAARPSESSWPRTTRPTSWSPAWSWRAWATASTSPTTAASPSSASPRRATTSSSWIARCPSSTATRRRDACAPAPSRASIRRSASSRSPPSRWRATARSAATPAWTTT